MIIIQEGEGVEASDARLHPFLTIIIINPILSTGRHNTPTLDNEAIANQLEALLTPAIAAQQKYYKQLGLRDRVLNLSLMVAA
jgi:hypothetical protein